MKERQWHGWRAHFHEQMVALPAASALKRLRENGWDRSDPPTSSFHSISEKRMARKKEVDTVQAVLDLDDHPVQMVLALEDAEVRRPAPATEQAPRPKVSREEALKGWLVLRRIMAKTVH